MRALSDSAYEADVPVGREKGLLWYYFVVDTPDGRVYAGKPEDDVCACYDHEPPSFQITVYDPAFEAPEWMRDSVMMQIMVDRFFIGGKANPPAGRGAYLHKSWNELPDLRPAAADGDAEAIDFFGGNLEGVREKLSYLKDLGIGAIYLNPVFRARSNHKYDVGDYLEIDPSFGTEADFERLTREAADAGIHVVLDGVFSHTGADSRYFNRYGTYPSVGAYQSPDSPYAKWYRIDPRTGKYDSWWGIDTLPNVNETEPSFLNFIVNGDDSVIAHYLRSGASGWRLDVADELPMEFIHALRLRAKAEGAQNCVIGEVWEDPTNKVSYGRPRSYALGDTLDSAMNYPLRDTVLAFFLGKQDAYHLANAVNHQLSTLPKPMLYSMMNLLGSHDKPRAINVLAGSQNLEPPREQRAFTPAHARTVRPRQRALRPRVRADHPAARHALPVLWRRSRPDRPWATPSAACPTRGAARIAPSRRVSNPSSAAVTRPPSSAAAIPPCAPSPPTPSKSPAPSTAHPNPSPSLEQSEQAAASFEKRRMPRLGIPA